MFRIGIVTVVDVKKRMARVRFPDVDIVSDWLPVLDHSSLVTLALKSDGKAWTISEKHSSADRELNSGAEYTKSHPDEISGKSPDIECAGGHVHTHEIAMKIYGWLPFIGQTVVCEYNDEFNGDGIIMGGLT